MARRLRHGEPDKGAILNIPVFATTQQKAKLGETCHELGLDSPGGIQTKCHIDKSAFSMWLVDTRSLPIPSNVLSASTTILKIAKH